MTSPQKSAVLEPMENMIRSGAQEGVITSPNSSLSHQSTGGMSEASSILSKSNSSTTNTSPHKVRSKAPTLDDIAARMKKTNLNDNIDAEVGDGE